MVRRSLIHENKTFQIIYYFYLCNNHFNIFKWMRCIQQIWKLPEPLSQPQISVNSQASGKIISLGKNEGTTVKQGDILATLDSSIQKLVVSQQEAIVEMKQAQLDSINLQYSSQKQGITATVSYNC